MLSRVSARPQPPRPAHPQDDEALRIAELRDAANLALRRNRLDSYRKIISEIDALGGRLVVVELACAGGAR